MPFDKQAFSLALAARLADIDQNTFKPQPDSAVQNEDERKALHVQALKRREASVALAMAEATEHAVAVALHDLWEDEHDQALDTPALVERADARRKAGDGESLMRAGALLLIAGAMLATKE